MGVQDGKPVSAAYTNPIFLNKNQADSMPFALTLDAVSSATIADIQATANKLYLATGVSETQSGTVYNATPGTIANGNDYQLALTILANKFDAATGHKHTGNPGDAPIIAVGGVESITIQGHSPPATGDIILFPGANIALTQVGDDITIAVVPQPVFGATGNQGSMGLAGASAGIFTQNPAASGSTYGVVWPSAQAPVSGDALLNDALGNLYWGPAGTSSPLTTKGDIYTYTSTNARQPVPGDYGRLIPDSQQTTGWRSAPYTSIWQGSPGKNYIQYSDFENGSTTGWSLGNVTLTSNLPTGVPTFGSGASGNLSLAIDSSTPLAGANSLKEVSSAATTAGNFVASSALTIDVEDQGKVLGFRFAYSPISNPSNGNFSGTSSNSFGVAIWDVTNSAWIIPAGVFNLVQNSGVGICTGTWQTPSNMTQFRIVIYNANATSGAITMDFDDFYCGPQTMAFGPAMTDPVSYTPTIGGGGTPTNVQVEYVRNGKMLRIYGSVTLGTVTAASASISLPSGLAIDYNAISNSANGQLVGIIWRLSGTTAWAGTSAGPWTLFVDGSTTGSVFVAIAPSSSAVFAKDNTNNFLSTGDGIQFLFEVPISGWSSNTAMSADTDTRVIAALVTSTVNTSISNTTWTIIPFSTVDTDTAGGWSTNTYTVPVTGKYDIGAYIGWSSSTATSFLAVYKNGSFYATVDGATSSSSTMYNSGSVKSIPCNAGDTLALYCWQNSGGALTLNAGGSPSSVTMVNSFSIARQSGPAIVQASEKVYLQYTNNGGNSITANTTNLTYSTKVIDSHNAWSGTIFTAPKTGFYLMTGHMSTTTNINTAIQMYLNGVASRTINPSSDISTTTIGLAGSIYMIAGDQLSFRSSASCTLNNSTNDHWIGISSQG